MVSLLHRATIKMIIRHMKALWPMNIRIMLISC